MRPTDLLRRDHQDALQLMDQLLAAGRGAQGKNPKHTEAFNDLQEALYLHTEIEEQELYPVLKSLDQTRDWVEQATKEHQEVEELLQQLAAKSPEVEEFQSILQQLRSSVLQHIEVEENQIFPVVETSLSQDQMQEIAARMQKMKSGKAESTKAASMRQRLH